MADVPRERRLFGETPGGRAGVVPYRRGSTDLQVVQQDDEEGAGNANQFWSVLRTLLRRRWLILAVLVTGLSIAATLTLLRVPQFRSSATLEIQRQETQIIEGADVEPATIADAEHMATLSVVGYPSLPLNVPTLRDGHRRRFGNADRQRILE